MTVQYCTVQCSAIQYSTVWAYMPALALLRVKSGSVGLEMKSLFFSFSSSSSTPTTARHWGGGGRGGGVVTWVLC